MSEYCVYIPISVTIPVRSSADNPSSAIAAAIKAVYGIMPISAQMSLHIDREQVKIDELPDGTPICGELWTGHDG